MEAFRLCRYRFGPRCAQKKTSAAGKERRDYRYLSKIFRGLDGTCLASFTATRPATTPEGPFAYFRIPLAILRPTCARHARWFCDAISQGRVQGLAWRLPPSRARPNDDRRNSRSTVRNFDNILECAIILRAWKRCAANDINLENSRILIKYISLI